MSGTALTTVSPSSVRIKRRVVCVAGCCGPKFKVHRNSWSTASSVEISRSVAMSTLSTGDDREVMAFAAAAQGVILAERVAGVFLWHQDAAQIRMALKHNAVQIVDFAFHPVRPFPQWKNGGDGQIRLIHECLDDDALAVVRVEQDVPQAEAIASIRILQVIGGAQLRKLIEAALVLEQRHRG